MRRRLPGALVALLLSTAASAPAGPAAAGDCARGTFEGTPFTACEVDAEERTPVTKLNRVEGRPTVNWLNPRMRK